MKLILFKFLYLTKQQKIDIMWWSWQPYHSFAHVHYKYWHSMKVSCTYCAFEKQLLTDGCPNQKIIDLVEFDLTVCVCACAYIDDLEITINRNRQPHTCACITHCIVQVAACNMSSYSLTLPKQSPSTEPTYTLDHQQHHTYDVVYIVVGSPRLAESIVFARAATLSIVGCLFVF